MERPSRAGDAPGRNNRGFDALSRNNEIVSFTKKAVYRMSLWLVNMREKFDAVPFFWSAHYDVGINYVGHASQRGAVSSPIHTAPEFVGIRKREQECFGMLMQPRFRRLPRAEKVHVVAEGSNDVGVHRFCLGQ